MSQPVPPDSAVTAARDPRVLRVARLLRDEGARRAEGAFVVDGEDLLAEALAAGIELELVLAAPAVAARLRAHPPGVPVIDAAPDALRALAAVGQAPTLAAICRLPPAPAEPVLVAHALVLSGVGGAGNVGSIVRTAAAFALPRVVVSRGCADPWSRKALRGALGATFAPGLVAGDAPPLRELAAGADRPPLAAALPRGGVAPDALPPGTAVVLGGERDGLGADEVACCDLAVSVPARGFESLNVAAAAAVLAYELARGRTRAAGAGGG